MCLCKLHCKESAKVEQEKAKVQLKALEQEKQKLLLNFEAFILDAT